MITQDQKDRRKSGLFSSDIARIMCGHSVEVALEKLGHSDRSTMLDDVTEIRLGKVCESLILQAYERDENCELEYSPDTIMHPTIEFLGVHLDALRLDNGRPAEAKTCGIYNMRQYGQPGTDQVPDYPLWQAHAFMACTDEPQVDIAVCFITLEATKYLILQDPPPISIYRIQRDFELQAMLERKAAMVWAYIQQGRTPPPESLSDVKLLYASAENRAVSATDEIADRMLEIMSAQDEIKAAEKRLEEQKFEVQKFMNTAAELRYGDQLLATWKNDADGHKVDLDKLEDDYPEVYKACLVPKIGSRKFLPKRKKEKK